MNDVDFIKWMCEKAGWKYNENIPKDIYYSNRWLPLLLQKAIEGVNRGPDYGYFFQFICKGNGMKIWLSRTGKSEMFIEEWDWTIEGKRSALEYIFTQEGESDE